jgi:5-methylthioadenosine/S-adenosylhomocysteine deaminase
MNGGASMIQIKKWRLLFVCLLTLCACSIIHAQDRTIIISGSVVTPEKVLSKGWVVIKHKKISAVSDTLPKEENAIWVDTNDIIFPGFIDLHNHPMYAMFEPWDARQLFNNRYEWRSLEKYKQEISTPARNIQDDPQGYCDIAEFAEVQAVTGGTTTFSGTFLLRSFGTTFPACLSRLAVRKLEIDSGFYSGHGHERVQNVLGVSRDLSDATAAEVRRKVATKVIDLVLIHVAEGKKTDPESTREFDLLKGRGFLAPTTAVIHGVAFDKSDFANMRSAATALVWSPKSNLILYNSTTDVVAAFREGVSIALAPDWAPSGSKNMLAEIKYAAELNRTSLGGFFSNQQLFEMATSIPARIARIDDKVGTIQPGLFADIFLLRGDATRPFDTLVQSEPQNVSLVVVNGVPIYGDATLMSKFNVTTEPVPFCGETKNLNLGVLPNGKLSDVRQRLGQKMEVYKLKLAKVDPCAQ